MSRGSSETSISESLAERMPMALLDLRGTYACCLTISLACGKSGSAGTACAVDGRRLFPHERHWCTFMGRVIKAAWSSEVPYWPTAASGEGVRSNM